MTPTQQRPYDPRQPSGIPQWLYQFLNSQGGMQGLLYQVGGIQGLLQLIQQQSQQPPPATNPNPNGIRYGQDPTGLSASDQAIADPWGWWDYLQDNHQADRPAPRTLPPSTGPLPVGNRATNSPFYRAPITTPAGSYIQASSSGSIPLTQAEMAQFMGATGKTGQDFLGALPGPIAPTGVTDEVRNNYNTADANLRAAMRAGNVTPELQQASANATNALMTAQYGPLWKMIGPQVSTGGAPQLQPANMLGGGGVYTPHAPKPAAPPAKWDYAAKYGYGPMSSSSPTIKVYPSGSDRTNVLQTLQAAGWDPSMGYGPQTTWGSPSSLQSVNDNRATMLNDLLYAISPRKKKAAPVKPEAPLPEAPDPFAGMQSAINRDAYVNDTLGGGFYGGLIPDEDAKNTWGYRQIGGAHDPHFPTPQLAMNPLPGDSQYDTYAGWASDQGQAFGTAPWASDSRWGQAQGFDDPKLYQQPPPPPTAWQPTPQFGNNAWGGTQGWGNTSRNGQQNNNNAWGNTSTQQQPMTFGTSPWDNPWGMR